MYVLLDTSTAVCRLVYIDADGAYHTYEWEAGRTMAQGLLAYIIKTLASHGTTIEAIAGWGVLRGPGSFTGLRIGAATVNAITASLQVPVVGETGEDWQARAVARLQAGEDDQIILPEYGRAARITTPRK